MMVKKIEEKSDSRELGDECSPLSEFSDGTTEAPRARLPRASLSCVDADGESNRETRRVSCDFFDEWNRIWVWYGRAGAGLDVSTF